jgi:hypothetical protein
MPIPNLAMQIRTVPERFAFWTTSLQFVMHQLIIVLGVAIIANLIIGYSFDLLRLLGHTYRMGYSYWLLTGMPFFPVQVICGLCLGWQLSRWLRHRAMLWVWVLPALMLCYGVFFRTDVPARFREMYRVGYTGPVFAAGSYSLGALLARKMLEEPCSSATEQTTNQP